MRLHPFIINKIKMGSSHIAYPPKATTLRYNKLVATSKLEIVRVLYGYTTNSNM